MEIWKNLGDWEKSLKFSQENWMGTEWDIGGGDQRGNRKSPALAVWGDHTGTVHSHSQVLTLGCFHLVLVLRIFICRVCSRRRYSVLLPFSVWLCVGQLRNNCILTELSSLHKLLILPDWPFPIHDVIIFPVTQPMNLPTAPLCSIQTTIRTPVQSYLLMYAVVFSKYFF